jgi:hypothetical protein
VDHRVDVEAVEKEKFLAPDVNGTLLLPTVYNYEDSKICKEKKSNGKKCTFLK